MIYFVRHGQSTANAGGVKMEHADIPLSEFGRAQAVRLAKPLDVDPVLVLTSTFLRARQTAASFRGRPGRRLCSVGVELQRRLVAQMLRQQVRVLAQAVGVALAWPATDNENV